MKLKYLVFLASVTLLGSFFLWPLFWEIDRQSRSGSMALSLSERLLLGLLTGEIPVAIIIILIIFFIFTHLRKKN